jgi:hypothetical protein
MCCKSCGGFGFARLCSVLLHVWKHSSKVVSWCAPNLFSYVMYGDCIVFWTHYVRKNHKMGRIRLGEHPAAAHSELGPASPRLRRRKVMGRAKADSLRIHRLGREDLKRKVDRAVDCRRKRLHQRTALCSQYPRPGRLFQHTVKYRWGPKKRLVSGTVVSVWRRNGGDFWIVITARNRTYRALCRCEIVEVVWRP